MAKKIVIRKASGGPSKVTRPKTIVARKSSIKETDGKAKKPNKSGPIDDEPVKTTIRKKKSAPKLKKKSSAASKKKAAAKKKAPEPFKFYCVRCGQKLKASGDMAEKMITCPSCSNTITVPIPLD